MRAQGAGRIVNVSSGTTRRAPAGVGGYAATKAARNLRTDAARKELPGEGIVVVLVGPWITAPEFAGGRFLRPRSRPAGMVPHSPECVGRIIVRAPRTGEARIDLPPGAEQPGRADVPPA